jgi:LCP family protein required for cell wall assembly
MAKAYRLEEKQGGSPAMKILQGVILAAFVIAAGLTAYLTYVSVRDLTMSWEMTDMPGIPVVNDPTSTPDAAGVIREPDVPLQVSAGPEPLEWDGASRVTMLLLGLDYRDWESGEGAPRSDTMILLTVDPINRTVGMLSIPRDLWVNIPGGYNPERINMAYRLGELYKYENGGGPGLAMETVEELLGVPIDYYAQVDFYAFERFIDEIGGVKLNVPEAITVDPMGDNNTKKLKPGVQTLPGNIALAYARVRKNAGDDFGRAERQQQVILAIRDRIISFDMLPTLIQKSGVLYEELSAGVHTNLTLDQALRLAWLAIQIPEENIKRGIIGPPKQVLLAKSPDGDDVLKPVTEEIRILRDDIFSSGPVSPAAASMSPEELVSAEGARVSVLNGTYTAGIASETSEYLKSLGVNVVEAGNAQQTTTYTTITFYTGKPHTLRYLVDLMQIDEFRIYHNYDPASPYDIQVVLGNDWINNNPMP